MLYLGMAVFILLPAIIPAQNVPVIYGVVVNDGVNITNERTIVLHISGNGIDEVCITETNGSFDNWIAYSDSIEYVLSDGDGWKELYLKARNAYGESEVYTLSVLLDTSPPPAPHIYSTTHPVPGKEYYSPEICIHWDIPCLLYTSPSPRD